MNLAHKVDKLDEAEVTVYGHHSTESVNGVN